MGTKQMTRKTLQVAGYQVDDLNLHEIIRTSTRLALPLSRRPCPPSFFVVNFFFHIRSFFLSLQPTFFISLYLFLSSSSFNLSSVLFFPTFLFLSSSRRKNIITARRAMRWPETKSTIQTSIKLRRLRMICSPTLTFSSVNKILGKLKLYEHNNDKKSFADVQTQSLRSKPP